MMNSPAIRSDCALRSTSDRPSASTPPCWHASFLQMLPQIQEHARFCFWHLKDDNRDEAVQEVVCNCCLAYARLVEQGRAESATWSSLAKYAVAQVRVGRRVGASLNVKDVSSRYCQKRKQVSVCSLDRWDDQDQEWTQMVVEDRHATPADLAALRIDFREFLRSLPRRNRQIAVQLAKRHTTEWIAERFKISSARVSQIRRELYEAWQRFQGETSGLSRAGAVAPA